MYYLLDDYDAALKDANQAINLDNRIVDAYHVRGLINLDTGEFDQAIADFFEAIKLVPDLAAAYNRRSMAPNFIDVYYNRGLVNYDRGAYQDALSDFDLVIEQYPEFGVAYIKRGATYGELREYDKAIADIERALKLELDASDRAAARQLLEELKAAHAGKSS